VAKHANIWNYVFGTVDDFQRKVGILKEHCAAVGRDPQEIDLSVQVRIDYDDVSEAAKRTQAFLDAGANHFVYTLNAPYPDDIVAQVADEVVSAVKL
jgi:alkanesulfonate monooxygenase SsuD/methylene tetrahydromethanopterin reductase-like flavin-dependent oxidoreductase (luciferase family)